MGTLRKLNRAQQSTLWKQLASYSTDTNRPDQAEVQRLLANVRQVVDQAEMIGDLVVRHMHQYTLHNKRHYLNVLALMDALVPKDLLAKLTPLECALCILAAYTHDLGMALPDAEYRALQTPETPEGQRYASYVSNFGEEQRQLDRWRDKGGPEAEERIRYIEGYLLASFLRSTHAEDMAPNETRIAHWLQRIQDTYKNQSLFTYKGYDFKQDLILINLSHNQPAVWLRTQLNKLHQDDDRGFFYLADEEEGNLAFPGLLLRLADLMDFDASRAPGIWFKHLGIEDDRSLIEWQKHRSVRGFQLKTDISKPILRYKAVCHHPVLEKEIRTYFQWIENEIKAVLQEETYQEQSLDDGERPCRLRLPHKVDFSIESRGYEYKDIEFRLDQDEILRILMGESLYGDPGLCVRELLQNALDAVRLRDLRLQVNDPKTDQLLANEKLNIELTWGTDTASGQEFIRVTDHGVGMTSYIIKYYFTQIGKSYYRSPEFARELARLQEKEPLSPISMFGIGILSCFMIADRLEVRTRPGKTDDEIRQPKDITISGPGSLFWLRQGTLSHQGTEITLFLKSDYKLYHKNDWLDHLREFFGYKASKADRVEMKAYQIDPALLAAQHVIWPTYPIELTPPSAPKIILDDHFHHRILAPLNTQQLISKSSEWNLKSQKLGQPEWGWWDWIDSTGPSATGTRIRLWFPRHWDTQLPLDASSEKEICSLHQLGAFAEPQLQGSRTKLMVRGMFVIDSTILYDQLPLVHGVGSRIWVDAHGAAAPKLTANRKQAILDSGNRSNWNRVWEGIWSRFYEKIKETANNPKTSPSHQFNLILNLRKLFRFRSNIEPRSPVPLSFSLLKGSNLSSHTLTLPTSLSCSLFLQDLAHDTQLSGINRYHLFSRDKDITREDDLLLKRKHDYNYARNRSLALAISSASDFNRDLARALALEKNLDSDVTKNLKYNTFLHLVQEGFWPSLQRSYALLSLSSMNGYIGNAELIAPSRMIFAYESDNCTLKFTDPDGIRPTKLVSYGYDLVFPLSAVPLGILRKTCNSWRIDRRLRRIGTLPFLLPELGRVWPKYRQSLQDIFRVEHIYAYFPPFRLWEKPFKAWTDDDFKHGISVLWNLNSGIVYWANGAQRLHRVLSIGKSYAYYNDAE